MNTTHRSEQEYMYMYCMFTRNRQTRVWISHGTDTATGNSDMVDFLAMVLSPFDSAQLI